MHCSRGMLCRVAHMLQHAMPEHAVVSRSCSWPLVRRLSDISPLTFCRHEVHHPHSSLPALCAARHHTAMEVEQHVTEATDNHTNGLQS